MSTAPNPFRIRDSERQRDHGAFVRTFGLHALEALPPRPWQKPLIIRSAPGAGKTSLMRLLTVDSLKVAGNLPERTFPIRARLRDLQAIDATGPALVSLYLNLDSDYRALLDLRVSAEVSQRLFFRLLDARLSIELVRSASVLANIPYPAQAAMVEVIPNDASADGALQRLGGRNGQQLIEAAIAAENELLDVLDILTADEQQMPTGHHRIYFLPALSKARILVNGQQVASKLMVMFDDGHTLHSSQRFALLDQLRNRDLTIERCYAERTEALDSDELIGAGIPNRDYEEVVLEEVFRRGASKFKNAIVDVADRRAEGTLARITDASTRFSDLIETDPDAVLEGNESRLLEIAGQISLQEAAGESRYGAWVEELTGYRGRDGLARLLELQVLILRDKDRNQGELFDEILPPAAIGERGSSNLREGALLRFATEQKLPYYSGLEMLAKLGSTNIEQALTLCGDLFAEVLLSVSVGRDPKLNANKQNRILKSASESYFRSIAAGVPNGPLVQTLVGGISRISAVEAAKPKIPYPPGVTGTAISMRDVNFLLEPERRQKLPGADLFYTALSSAVAYNVVTIDKDYAVKRARYMVIYLNRLLCPRFNMPLGYGAFRERPLADIASWFVESPSSRRAQTQESLM